MTSSAPAPAGLAWSRDVSTRLEALEGRLRRAERALAEERERGAARDYRVAELERALAALRAAPAPSAPAAPPLGPLATPAGDAVSVSLTQAAALIGRSARQVLRIGLAGELDLIDQRRPGAKHGAYRVALTSVARFLAASRNVHRVHRPSRQREQ